jgi:hypothetical protein
MPREPPPNDMEPKVPSSDTAARFDAESNTGRRRVDTERQMDWCFAIRSCAAATERRGRTTSQLRRQHSAGHAQHDTYSCKLAAADGAGNARADISKLHRVKGSRAAAHHTTAGSLACSSHAPPPAPTQQHTRRVVCDRRGSARRAATGSNARSPAAFQRQHRAPAAANSSPCTCSGLFRPALAVAHVTFQVHFAVAHKRQHVAHTTEMDGRTTSTAMRAPRTEKGRRRTGTAAPQTRSFPRTPFGGASVTRGRTSCRT